MFFVIILGEKAETYSQMKWYHLCKKDGVSNRIVYVWMKGYRVWPEDIGAIYAVYHAL